jgi:hypothetical protein
MELKLTERIDYDAIEQFYDDWELEWIIDFDQFKEIIVEKIIEMADVDSIETESDVIFINGKDCHQYDIDIEFDHEDGSAWIYPTAYGKRLNEDTVCVLLKQEKLKLDDDIFDVKCIGSFINDWLLDLKITVPHIIDKIHDYTDTLLEFPADEWREIDIYGGYKIDAHFTVEQDGDTGDITETICVYPISYGKTLTRFEHVVYKRTVKNDRA